MRNRDGLFRRKEVKECLLRGATVSEVGPVRISQRLGSANVEGLSVAHSGEGPFLPVGLIAVVSSGPVPRVVLADRRLLELCS
jgi:hypothetical protein